MTCPQTPTGHTSCSDCWLAVTRWPQASSAVQASSGQSPNEVRLVGAAQRIDMTFVDLGGNRGGTLTLIVGPREEGHMEEVKVQLLALFPFDRWAIIDFYSVRARISVIIRDEKGVIKLYCKGSGERLSTLIAKSP